MSDTEKSIPKSIAVGLVKAQAYTRGVDKNGRNTSAKYDYATSEDIIAEGRIALIEGGRIAFSVLGWEHVEIEAREAKTRVKDGKTMALAQATHRIKVRYVLLNLDTGELYEDYTTAPVVPEFGRPDDKAEYGALTEAHAYTLRGLLNLPRGVDGAVRMNERPDEAPVETPGRDNAPRRPEPANDRAPDSDRQRREEPPRSAPVDTRSEHRKAADLAVEAQVGAHAAHPPAGPPQPAADPAQQALALDLMRQANARPEKGSNGPWPDPADLFDKLRDAKLPADLRIKPLRAILLLAFASAADTEAVRGWHGIAVKQNLPDDARTDVLIECFVAACEVAQNADEFDSWQHDMHASGIRSPRLVEAFRKAADRTGWKPGKKAA